MKYAAIISSSSLQMRNATDERAKVVDEKSAELKAGQAQMQGVICGLVEQIGKLRDEVEQNADSASANIATVCFCTKYGVSGILKIETYKSGRGSPQ